MTMSIIRSVSLLIIWLLPIWGCQNKAPNFSKNLVDLQKADLTIFRPDYNKDQARDTIIETTIFKFRFLETTLSIEEMTSLVKEVDVNYQRLSKMIDLGAFNRQLDYLVYPGIEKIGLARQSGVIGQVSHPQQKVFVVSGRFFQGHQLCPENELFLRWKLGKPHHLALEKGMAIYLNPNWQKRGFDHWVERLFHAESLPPLAELLDEEWLRIESDLVMGCASAAFVDFLITQRGLDTFLNEYKDFKPGKNEIKALQSQWEAYLKSKYGQPKPLKRRNAVPRLKGFNFAHEGYRVYNGYGSKLAEASLEELFSLGSNALAIVPYSYMESDARPSFLPIMRRAGMETDESVIATHLQAKQWNAFTMLKPQIWIRGSWPGNIKMKNSTDWQKFFDYYYRWMRHYALLAEIWEMDMLCVGVEFAEATKSNPEAWRKLIRKLRGIYTGPMTYAANWGAEFEDMTFWDELDYLGLDCYYPLSKDANPTRAALENGFEETVRKIESVCNRWGKPVIFTEIGFRSVEQTWVQPHEETNGRNIDEDGQQLCYEIVLSQIMNKDWCRGIIWWKWPSYINYDNRKGTGFTPSGKKAERVVEYWFSGKNQNQEIGE
jgi:hypothetical protein